MRKLIIKFFALDYIVRVFGSTYNWTRGANIIFPLFILAGMCLLSELYVLLCIMVCLIAIAVFFGFAYFQLFPLTENDRKYFDDVQRWQFNRYYNIQQQIDVKTNSIWCLLSNIIFIALFLVCYFIEFV
nr:MAG TPA: hypothetical protein [Caudoviricetes sp.]